MRDHNGGRITTRTKVGDVVINGFGICNVLTVCVCAGAGVCVCVHTKRREHISNIYLIN